MKYLMSVFTALSLSLSTLLAAEPRAEVLIDTESFYVGDSFGMTIGVVNLLDPQEPDLSVITNALVTPMDMQINATGTTHSMHYLITPKTTGTLVIPPLSVANIETAVSTDPQTIEIQEPQKTDKLSMAITLSKKECYAGEAVTLDVRWKSQIPLNAIKALDIIVPIMQHPAVQLHNPSLMTLAAEKNTVGLPVNRTRIIAQQEDAVTYFFRGLTIAEPGTYTFRPGHILCSVEENPGRRGSGFQYPSYFDNQFFKDNLRGKFKKLYSRSKPTGLTVLPLPKDGQPATFQGLIGKCDMRTTVTPTEAQIGDPLNFQLTLAGHHAPDTLSPPDLSRFRAFTTSFDIVEGKTRSRLEKGNRIFSYTLLPKKIGIDGIPAFTLSGFDPNTKAYFDLASAPIKMTIRKATVASASDAVLSDGTRLGTTLEETPDGIYAADSIGDMIDAGHHARKTSTALLVLLFFLPPIVWLAVMFTTEKARFRRSHPAEARRREALTRFNRALRNVRAEALHHDKWLGSVTAVRGFFADILNASPDAITWSDIDTLDSVQRLSDKDRTALKKVFDLEAQQRFSEKPVDHTPESMRVPRAVIEKIAHSILILMLCGMSMGMNPKTIPDVNLSIQAQQLMREAMTADAQGHRNVEQLYERSALVHDELAKKQFNGATSLAAGNAWFKANNMGKAILHYRRAAWFMPTDKRVVHNLEEARDAAPDQIAPPEVSLFLARAHPGQSQTVLHTITMLFIAAWLFSWTGMIIAMFDPAKWLRRALVVSFGLSVICASLIIADRFLAQATQHGVITGDAIQAHKGDSDIYEAALSSRLHSGTEVLIRERRGLWTLIELGNGMTGWIPSSSVDAVF